jgi:hypothetical protein
LPPPLPPPPPRGRSPACAAVRLVGIGEVGVGLALEGGELGPHIKNIYGKLDAHTRTQALARAKELGLL